MFQTRYLVLAIFASFTSASYAYDAEKQSAVFSPLEIFGKLTIALAAVLFCFWIFSLVVKQLRGGTLKTSENLKIVTALPIGQRERLLVIQVADQQLLIGATAETITKLHVLDTPIVLNTGGEGGESGDFRSILKLALTKQVPR